MKLKLLHLFPDLLNQYFDSGNLTLMRKRLEWRGIDCEVVAHTARDTVLDLSDVDIALLGGGGDDEQQFVCGSLLDRKNELQGYVEDGGTLLAVCGGYQLLGNYYRLQNKTVEGVGILDIYTEPGKRRLIGDVILETDFLPEAHRLVVGFENHGGRTFIGKHRPFGRVLYGNGNTDARDFDGVRYKNVLATYLHGPLLSKSPALCDHLLTGALTRKYGDFGALAPLDDTLGHRANAAIVKRYSSTNKRKRG